MLICETQVPLTCWDNTSSIGTGVPSRKVRLLPRVEDSSAMVGSVSLCDPIRMVWYWDSTCSGAGRSAWGREVSHPDTASVSNQIT